MIIAMQARRSLVDRDLGAVILTVTLSFFLYVSTLAPTVTWGDPAKLTVYAYNLYLRVWGANHLLRNLIGWLWGQLPFPDYAYGQNLLSAVFAALTVGVVCAIVLKLTSSHFAAILSSLSLGISHTFWWLAVVAESYSLLFFLLAVCILSCVMWIRAKHDAWLYLLAFSFALGVIDHAVMLLLAPAFVLFLLAGDPRLPFKGRTLAGVGLAIVVGFSPLIGTFMLSLRWFTADQLLYQMTSGTLAPYWMGAQKILRETVMYGAYLGYQFPGFGVLLGLVGALVMFISRCKELLLFASIFLLDVLFSAGYMYQRQFEILVPSYIVFALTIGVGISHLQNRFRDIVSVRLLVRVLPLFLVGSFILTPMLVYYVSPYVLQEIGKDPLSVREIPYRDNLRYFFLPAKNGYYGARKYGLEVFSMLPSDAVVLADFTPGVVLEYMQTVEGIRRDVSIVAVEVQGPMGETALEAVRQNSGRRPIYLTDYRAYPALFAVERLTEHYEFEADGLVFRLVEKP